MKQRVLPDDTIEVGWPDTEGETCWCSPRVEEVPPASLAELFNPYADDPNDGEFPATREDEGKVQEGWAAATAHIDQIRFPGFVWKQKEGGPVRISRDTPSRHPSSQRFHQILQELGELHDQKSIGYGTDEDPLANVRSSEEWCVPAWTGCMIRAQDKIRRLQAFSQKGELPFEAIEDAFRDLAVYSIIGLILFEEQAA